MENKLEQFIKGIEKECSTFDSYPTAERIMSIIRQAHLLGKEEGKAEERKRIVEGVKKVEMAYSSEKENIINLIEKQ